MTKVFYIDSCAGFNALMVGSIQRLARGLFIALILGLVACGGGSDSPTNNPSPGPGQTPPDPDPDPDPDPQPAAALYTLVDDDGARDAVRFLTQATFGATEETIRGLMATTQEAWIDGQMTLPLTRQLPLVDQRIREDGLDPLDKSNDEHAYLKDLHRSDIWWDTVMQGNDQLRQRVAYALSQIFVVSNVSDTLFHDVRGISDYHDTLAAHAFGNFRTLLESVTLHPMMGEYLSMVRNEKADSVRNIRPDENYARELMQLFSIGLVMLNTDGSEQLDSNGQSIPTYDQETIKAFARVFTGWMYGNAPRWYWFDWLPTSEVIPMTAFEAFHDTGVKTLLGGQILPAGQSAMDDLTAALDNIFRHQNTAPFISKQLIQRLVTSNPSPAYVQRVSDTFNDNGRGVKGDMAAVIKAILLDEDARSGHLSQPTTFGKLKEPMLKVGSVWRAFDVLGVPSIDENGNEGVPVIRFYGAGRESGQRPYGSPSVFNFYRPEFSQTGAIRQAGLASPEFQILSENAITSTINRLFFTAYLSDKDNPDLAQNFNALWDVGLVKLDFSTEKALAENPQRLVDRLNLLLMAGQMSAAMEQALVQYLEAIPPASEALIHLRVNEALFLIASSPEFSVQR